MPLLDDLRLERDAIAGRADAGDQRAGQVILWVLR
jgi:hypothetical protein